MSLKGIVLNQLLGSFMSSAEKHTLFENRFMIFQSSVLRARFKKRFRQILGLYIESCSPQNQNSAAIFWC